MNGLRNSLRGKRASRARSLSSSSGSPSWRSPWPRRTDGGLLPRCREPRSLRHEGDDTRRASPTIGYRLSTALCDSGSRNGAPWARPRPGISPRPVEVGAPVAARDVTGRYGRDGSERATCTGSAGPRHPLPVLRWAACCRRLARDRCGLGHDRLPRLRRPSGGRGPAPARNASTVGAANAGVITRVSADHGRRERRGSRARQPSASSSNVFPSRAVRRISSRAAGERRSRSACKASIQSVRILGSCVRDEVDVSTRGGSSPHGLGLSNWPGTTLALTHRVPIDPRSVRVLKPVCGVLQ